MRKASVLLYGIKAGVLEELEEGARFTYAPEWLAAPGAVPVSSTLPLRPEPFEVRRGVHPFFENMLPEGWLLNLSLRSLHMSADDVFGMVLAFCRDCIGAVQVVPE